MLVLNEVDKLSKEAQHSLRRTMEKYSSSCRLILCCNSSSKVTEAVRSRCLNVRINAPNNEEVIEQEGWADILVKKLFYSGIGVLLGERGMRSLLFSSFNVMFVAIVFPTSYVVYIYICYWHVQHCM